VVASDPESARVQWLTGRAARAGYRLVRGPGYPHAWILRDASDDAPIHSAATLDDIEKWLNT
jgi:hypothetical protein